MQSTVRVDCSPARKNCAIRCKTGRTDFVTTDKRLIIKTRWDASSVVVGLMAAAFFWGQSQYAAAQSESAPVVVAESKPGPSTPARSKPVAAGAATLGDGIAAVVRAAEPSSASKTVGRCGNGWLEKVGEYSVLHVSGTPYEMGYQHGLLLKDRVRSNMHNILTLKANETVKMGPLTIKPRAAIELILEIQRPHVPARYFEEMAGLAAGADLPLDDIIVANFIPELFHCSGFAVMNSATQDGRLYHGRVLDYATDWGLQDHCVLIVAEPNDRTPFVNVSYAGFVGSVTGMNSKSISVGEMGGGGFGRWDGVPMALLVREALETADSLDAAVAVFRDNPRTCQYFYVIADGKAKTAVGMEASAGVFTVIRPGESNPQLPRPVKDAVLLSAGKRYDLLVDRVQAAHGKITSESAIGLMDCPVAMKSNLHDVLFEPETTRFWVANASSDKQPAANQPYHAFMLSDLLRRTPAADVSVTPIPAARPIVDTAAIVR